MIIIAIGQMNLAVGAIGGLAAISFARHDAGLGACRRRWRPRLALAASASRAASSTAVLIAAHRASPASSSRSRRCRSSRASISASPGRSRSTACPTASRRSAIRTFLGPLPWLMLPATAVVVRAMWYCSTAMPLGRYMLAVGGNPNAAELSGISVPRTVVWAHALSGLLAALAGVMLGRAAADRRSRRSATTG